MDSNWSSFTSGTTSGEFDHECVFFKKTEGNKYASPPTADSYDAKLECGGKLVPASADDTGFAEGAQYTLSIPFPEGTTPIYVNDTVTVTTEQETIDCVVSRTLPVSSLRKLKMYVTRSTWNTDPDLS